MNYEVEMVFKEPVMALLKHILDICLEGQENQEKPHSE
jgi:hypothetical protein